jgi:hypothetical protein
MTRLTLSAQMVSSVALAAFVAAPAAMAQDAAPAGEAAEAEVQSAETPEDGASGAAPQFRVVPDWPQPLPNEWRLGQVAGISVGPDDTIWIVQRPRTLASSAAGATDAMEGVFVCNEGGPGVEEGASCEEGDEFGTAVAADAFGNARPDGPIAERGLPAPAVMQFDQEGNLLTAWGGPEVHDGANWAWPEPLWTNADGVECEWPAGEHGIFVDDEGMIYIASNGSGDGSTSSGGNDQGWDGHILKFTPDGECVMQIGAPLGEGSAADLADSNATDGGANGTPQLFRPANMHVHEDELFIADGYGNRRIVVVDRNTGEYRRHWGAYGAVSVDDAIPGPFAEDRPAEENLPAVFRTPVHCVRIADDGLIYVCDRVNNRIQVFDMSVGTDETCTDPAQEPDNGCGFVMERFIRADTLGNGSVWDIAMSPDEEQSCLHQADGTNQQVYTLHRPTLEVLDAFGGSGRMAGLFHWIHDIAADSQGNLYTTEVDTAQRAQKFERVSGEGCAEPGN